MDLIDIPQVHTSEFRPRRLGGEPRVVIGNVDTWAAFGLWQPDYLKAVAGNQKVSVRETVGPPRNIYQNLSQGGEILFSQYIDWVLEIANGDDFKDYLRKYSDVSDITRAICESGFECSYYLDTKLADFSTDLLRDVKTPSWYSVDPVDVIFWCGVLGTSSGLHSDVTPNCNVQILGHKHFILFPPSQSRLLYQVPGRTHCQFDPNIPDFIRFPLARKALGWQCTLHPGQSLYIPVGWFHQVTVTSGWALNVNFFWPRPFPQGLITRSLWRILLWRSWVRLHRIFYQKHNSRCWQLRQGKGNTHGQMSVRPE